MASSPQPIPINRIEVSLVSKKVIIFPDKINIPINFKKFLLLILMYIVNRT